MIPRKPFLILLLCESSPIWRKSGNLKALSLMTDDSLASLLGKEKVNLIDTIISATTNANNANPSHPSIWSRLIAFLS